MRHSDVEFNIVENEGERRGGSLLSAVGLWVRGPIETFLSGLLGQQWSSDLSLCQLKVDMPPSTTPESDFTNSTVSTWALKKAEFISKIYLSAFQLSNLFPIKKITVRKSYGQRSSPFLHCQQTQRAMLIKSTRIWCCRALQAYLPTLISPPPSPTLPYKTQVCKHKGLPRPHKR